MSQVGIINGYFKGSIEKNNIIYVSKDGNDNNNGTFSDPFLTIEYANNYAIAHLPDWPGRIIIKVAPGIYTEHLTQAFYRVNIVGILDPSEKGMQVIIRNTGADEAHYIFGMTSGGPHMTGITIETSDAANEPIEGIYGKLQPSSVFNYCHFHNGYFIEQTDLANNIYQYMYKCYFLGASYGFKLEGAVTADVHFLNFESCMIDNSKDCIFSSTNATNTVKLNNCYITQKINIKGSYSLLTLSSETYGSNSGLEFDTTGYVDITGGTQHTGNIHFISDTTNYKKISNYTFKDVNATHDITADVAISNVEYINNNQDKGLSSEIQITNTERTVGKHGEDYATIKDALASIQNNSINNRFTINITPGVYEEENPIQTKEYVSISSPGRSDVTKIIAKNTNQHIFLGNKNSTITNVKLADAFGATAIYCTFSGITYYKNITFCNCKNGVKVNNQNANISMYNIQFDTSSSGIFDEGILIENGNADVRDLNVTNHAQITTLIKSTGSNSKIDLWNIQSESPNVINGLYATSGGKITAISSDLGYTTNAVRIEQNSYVCARNCVSSNSKEYDLWISGNGAYHGHASTLTRDKIYDQDKQALIYGFGGDADTKVFRSIADYSVGMPYQPNDTFLGEGGPYQDGVKAMTFDGNLTYTDVTSLSGISFPNTNSGTCIYFGELNNHCWYGLQYLQGDTTLSGGTVEWQYYDGSSGWTKVNTLNTIDGYSNSYTNNSFIGDENILQSVRFDADIKTGVTESDSNATGWSNITINGDEAKWVRCMIISPISQSPKFEIIRFKGNYMRVRGNGTCSYNGEARNLKCDMVVFGDNSGTGANKSLDISPNITYPYWTNSLSTHTQRLYFRFLINETVDTSCGLNLKYTVSTPFTDTSDAVCTLNIYTAIITEDDAFVNTNPEVLQTDTFNYTANEVANKVRIKTLSRRIDISKCKTNDVVYVCFKRVSGATMSDSIDMSNICFLYKSWQNGENILI